MVQAYKGNIIMPNRHEDPVGNTYRGHLLESETYVGGHVEALEAGVFRSDIETDFRVDPAAIQQLIDDLDAALQFSIREEGKLALDDIENYEEVKAEIRTMLEVMRDDPNRKDCPLIYHLDVAAMYPTSCSATGSSRLDGQRGHVRHLRLQPPGHEVRQAHGLGLARRVLPRQARTRST